MVHDVADSLIAGGSIPSHVCLVIRERCERAAAIVMTRDLNLPGVGVGIPASGLVTSVWQAIM